MAETILAGEWVKEFPGKDRFSFLAFFNAKLTKFHKDLFVCNSPCHAGNRYGKDKQVDDLF